MKCILCKSSETNIELGEMKVLGDIHVHYFCMLLSSSLLTNGKEDEGIMGFLPADIKKESRRASRLKCTYCQRMGATVGCCVPTCNRSFHLNCGLKHNCLSQFDAEFRSFCDRHVDINEPKHSSNYTCIICLVEIGEYDKLKSIFAPCCKSEWFHKICLMELAESAGYFFKCPKCNDVDKFSLNCKRRGIFIPQRDASWETEINAYHELMERPNKCSAENCRCGDGRESNKTSNPLLICETCGSNCIHKKCWRRNEEYYCCSPIYSTINEEVPHNRNREIELPEQDSKIKYENQNYNVSNISFETTSTSSEFRVTRKRKLSTASSQENTMPDMKRYKSSASSSRMSQRSIQNAETSLIKMYNLPITKIRNGHIDQILRYTPRILIRPLSPEILKTLTNKIACSMRDKAVEISNFKNVTIKKNSKSKIVSEFAIISPAKKNNGKSFKNYTITSFFKPSNLQ